MGPAVQFLVKKQKKKEKKKEKKKTKTFCDVSPCNQIAIISFPIKAKKVISIKIIAIKNHIFWR